MQDSEKSPSLGRENGLNNHALREARGKRTSFLGLFANLVLFVLKFLLGWLSGHVSVLSDAFNNLSDAASSGIALISFKLSNKLPDDKHPFGHARTEYLGTSLIAVIILVIAFEMARESLGQIANPQEVRFSWILIGALLLSMLVKLALFFYYRKEGQAIRSRLLEANARDALGDVAASAAVLTGVILQEQTGLRIDGWLGLAVSVFIAYQGFAILRETFDRMMGQTPSPELIKALTERILSNPDILGLHDLVIHDYGPGRQFATVHVEIDAKKDVLISHEIIDTIEKDVKLEMEIELLIHMDPIVMDDPEVNAKRTEVSMLVTSLDPRLSLHDFRVVDEKGIRTLYFDVTIPPDMEEEVAEDVRQRLVMQIEARHPDVKTHITLDREYTTNQPSS